MNTGNVGGAAPDRGRLARTGGVVLLLAAAVALPFVSSSPYVLDVAILMLFYMCLALGLNVVVGYAGLLDLGYAAYFAVGAYTLGILTKTFHVNFWLALLASGLFAMLLGLFIGMTVLRLRSDYLDHGHPGLRRDHPHHRQQPEDHGRPHGHLRHHGAEGLRPVAGAAPQHLLRHADPGGAHHHRHGAPRQLPGRAAHGPASGRTRTPRRPWGSTRWATSCWRISPAPSGAGSRGRSSP